MFNNKIGNTRDDKRLEESSAPSTESEEKNHDRVSGSQAATMVVSVKDEYGKAMTVGSLTVLISGKGLLGTGTGPATEFIPTGRAISVSLSNSVPGKYVFALFGARDGSV